MNSKRRAELQRKLSMGAVPRPPAGLADRIKGDIPNYLAPHAAPDRFSWWNTLRVAASIMLLLTTAIVTYELMRPAERRAPSAVAEKVEPAVLTYRDRPRTAADSVTDSVTATRAETEVSLEIAEEMPIPAPVAQAAPPPAAGRVVATEAAGGANVETDAGWLGDIAGTERKERTEEPVQIAEAAAPPPPPEPVVPPRGVERMETAPAPAPAPSAAPQRRRDAAADYALAAPPPPAPSASLVPEAYAKTLQLQPSSVFGISVDPNAFPAVRTAIETGERPAPGIVNVEALVNYFAGAKAPRREVALEVEASPAPIAVEGDDRAILRFTVDTAAIDVPPRGSTPPVARDARLRIDIDSRAVATFRRIGEGDAASSEHALLYNTSVTGLYELSLKPNLRASQRVATVTLRYISVKTGKPVSVSRVIHGHDLARTWEKASRRHRLAALGAIWSETLKGTNGGSEVARRAEELATQNPRDSRARELANAASASTGGAP